MKTGTVSPLVARLAKSWRTLAALWGAQMVLTWLFLIAWSAHIDSVSTDEWWGGFKTSTFVENFIDGYWLLFAGAAGVFAVQALFLLPVRKPRARMARGRSLWVSLVVAGACIAILAGGLFAAVAHVANLEMVPAFWITLGGSWVVFSALLIAYVRKRPRDAPESLLATIARRIFRGTIVEALAIVPLDVILRRRESCYCFAGSVFGYAACLAVGTVFLGPAIFLPLLAKSRELHFYERRCDGCAAPLDGVDLHAQSLRDAPSFAECPRCKLPFKVESAS